MSQSLRSNQPTNQTNKKTEWFKEMLGIIERKGAGSGAPIPCQAPGPAREPGWYGRASRAEIAWAVPHLKDQVNTPGSSAAHTFGGGAPWS